MNKKQKRGRQERRHGLLRSARGSDSHLEAQKAQERLLREACSPVWGGRQAPKEIARPPSVELAISNEIGVGWKPEEGGFLELLKQEEAAGIGLQPHGGLSGAARDVVLGLDFGTSSTKVVLADHSLDEAYAVPFNDSVGVSRYLLPSALVETDGGQYALSGEGLRHADLKLSMLLDQDDPLRCSRVCAFLALTIRRARAWLFETRREQYLRSDILWTLAIGLPSDQATYFGQQLHFMKLAQVAWALAGSGKPVCVREAREAWCGRQNLDLGEELEVRLLPELSAQIHGFVSSSHFDVKESNLYLMVDVGAGTLDASLFNVRKDKGGKVSFGFFTHSVEHLGAANLHRHRLDWWRSRLQDASGEEAAEAARLSGRVAAVVDHLAALRLPTDFHGGYPSTYDQYVTGVQVRFKGGAKTPDDEFYQWVRHQVIGKVLYAAWKDRLLTEGELRNLPFFLCGGGARHPLFESLKSGLRHTQNFSWLGARPRDLIKPSRMHAPGVPDGDYDRLSVAYGLSQLNLGAFEQAGALKPLASTPRSKDLESLFVDKSVC